MNLDRILKKYDIITERQEKKPERIKQEIQEYIPAAASRNFKDTGEATNLRLNYVHELKNKLAAMTEEERDFVIASLMADKVFGGEETAD